ncbi:MAG: hemolysin family protein [Rhodospirillales bacterium]|nr:hemolysin family protein [Rhodospirillales bacterium]
MSISLEIAVIFFLVLLNGLFAMSELAIVSARKARLAAKADEGSKGAKIALKLQENPGRFLSSVQIGITLVGILTGAFSGVTLAGHLAVWLAETFPETAPASEILSLVLVVGGITYLSLIAGELVPKQIALANPEGIAIRAARPMALVARSASPLVWVLERSSKLMLKILGVRKSSGQTVTEEEVRAMIAEGTESGIFEPQEKELISGVMRFGDRKIKAIMTPRNQIVSIDLEWDEAKIAAVILKCPHSRIPVTKGNSEEVLGVVQAKDIADAFLAGSPFDAAQLVKRVEVVHDNAPALSVLDILKRSPIHLAVVVDEYGGLEGIVTTADILSSIVGSLFEHGEEYEGVLIQREDGSWLADGDAAVDIVAERTGCRVVIQDKGDYVTLAGFILSKSRSLPSTGERFDWEGWRFEIVDMDKRRIDKVLLSRIEQN